MNLSEARQLYNERPKIYSEISQQYFWFIGSNSCKTFSDDDVGWQLFVEFNPIPRGGVSEHPIGGQDMH